MPQTSQRLMFVLTRSALLVALLLTVQLAAGGGRAHACSCAEPAPPLEALDEAAAVFSGTVVSFETFTFEVDFGSGMSDTFWSVEFDVDAVWKGPGALTTFVYVWHGPACGYGNFEVGTDFLVYAHQRDFPGVHADTLFVSSCSRTRPLEHAGEDLEALGDGQAPESGIAGADPASSAEEEAPDPDPTSETPPHGPTLATTGYGPAPDDVRSSSPGATDAAGLPAWAIALLAMLVGVVLLIRLATQPDDGSSRP